VSRRLIPFLVTTRVSPAKQFSIWRPVQSDRLPAPFRYVIAIDLRSNFSISSTFAIGYDKKRPSGRRHSSVPRSRLGMNTYCSSPASKVVVGLFIAEKAAPSH
jgi:hypothetical protein